MIYGRLNALLSKNLLTQIKPYSVLFNNTFKTKHNQVALNVKNAFSTSSKHNAIPPLFWLIFIKPISKVAAIIVGRGSRKWWQNLRPHLKPAVVKDHVLRNRTRYIVGTSTITIGGSVFYYIHVQTTPITNRRRFILFMPFQILEVEELSKSAFIETYGSNIISTQTHDVNRVLNVLNRLVSSNKDIKEIAETNWHITLIKEDIVNAAAFPSGHIIVFTGLLDYVRNDDELAAVLGHEISHAILQHTAENLSRSRLIDFFSIILVLTIWTVFPSDLTAGIVHYFSNKFLDVALELPFSRFLESEADEVGLILAAKACYDVRYIPELWRRQSDDDTDEIPEIFSTHPGNLHRANDIEKLIPEALRLREKCKCAKLPEKIDIAMAQTATVKTNNSSK